MVNMHEYRISRYQRHIDRIQLIMRRISNFRIISFILLLTFMFLSIQIALFSILSLIALFGFIICVKRYQSLEKRRQFFLAKQNYQRMNQMRLNGEWKQFDFSSKNLNFKQSHISLDMDIFGANSLFQYLWINASTAGDQRLADYLAKMAPLADLTDVQEAINELQSMEYLRSTILAKIHSETLDKFDIRGIFSWLKKPIKLSRFDQLLAWSPLITIALFLASIILPVLSFAVAYVFFQFIIVLLRQSVWIEFYEQILEKNKIFFAYRDILKLIAGHAFKSKKLRGINQSFSGDNADLQNAFTTFQKLINRLSLRYSDVAHNTMNSLFMWDILAIKRLAVWQERYKNKIPEWFDNLSEFEFLMAIANFYKINPDFSFPDLSPKQIDFQEIGHPLIAKESRVCNDFRINSGQIAIITGSNMAGKTTFLRTVAVNLVLAYCGAPVCAKSFASPVLILESSIKITDSLSDGVSFFYAEVKRLKEIIECLKKETHVIFFIDEMLKGTNNRERFLASDNLIRQMLRTNGIGLFSTHDLELVKLADEFKDSVINYHFSEDASSESLSFDYKLKNGPVKSTNAIQILKREGLFDQGLE